MKWYAIYTKSRNEKKVYARLIEAGIDCFLPMFKTLKQWSDRKKWIEEPLFRSYLFVHINDSQYYDVLNTPGVVRYITFEGKAAPIPPLQITAIKLFINAEEEITNNLPDFKVGDKVEIFKGQLKGLTGYLIENKGKQKVKVEIEAIGHSIDLTIPKSHLKTISF